MGKFPDQNDKEIIKLILKISLYGTMTYYAIHKNETELVSILMNITKIVSETL